MSQSDADTVKRALLNLGICGHCGKEKPLAEIRIRKSGSPQPCDLCVLHKPVTNDRCMEPGWDPR